MNTQSLVELKGIGEKIATQLQAMGLRTVYDLVWNFPRAYDDYSNVVPIAQITPGKVTIRAKLSSGVSRYSRKGLHMTQVLATDPTGSVTILWFNQPYRLTSIEQGTEYYISGEFSLKATRLSITNPSIEKIDAKKNHTAKIVPIYRESKQISSRQLRVFIEQALNKYVCSESLPLWLVEHYRLIPLKTALQELHFPTDAEHLDAAKRRIAFEEVLALVLASELNRLENQKLTAKSVAFKQDAAQAFVAELPFTLSDDQKRAIWSIYKDIEQTTPMNRLLEGDVGSGKTVIAAMAALMVVEAGYQVAIMAPTEILARQHYKTLQNVLQYGKHAELVHMLIGALTPKQKTAVQEKIKNGSAGIIVGTQALLSPKVAFHDLGLVVIDEQHRFGVEQRRLLQERLGYMPHILTMTATPIPRTLALTVYGELDVSQIKTKPKGRKPITTELFPSEARVEVYRRVATQLEQGRQAYVVCPLITDSETLAVRSAETIYQELQKTYLKGRKIALLHGKMKPIEKEQIMQQYLNGESEVLVSTTVIEVGVDVPNATVMVIEGAERFGLAQLHQLRGRVGRSDLNSFCYVITTTNDAPGKRLRAFTTSQDGFKLAELDLELRGPGALYGLRQSGELDLKIARLSDLTLIAEVREAAKLCIKKNENMIQYPQLQKHIKKAQIITHFN